MATAKAETVTVTVTRGAVDHDGEREQWGADRRAALRGLLMGSRHWLYTASPQHVGAGLLMGSRQPSAS